MFAIEKKYGIIRKEHPAHAKADFLSALLTPNLYKASDFAAFVKNKLGYDLSVM